jgi:hypothetical protein
MVTETIATTDVPTHWPEILTKLLEGEREFLVTEDQQVKAVIIDHTLYQKLKNRAAREVRRQQALSLPLMAADTTGTDESGFEILETISQKFSALSDEEIDILFSEILAEMRDAERK